MRVTITASIRLFFILTLVAISVVAQTGLLSASASAPAGVQTTRVPDIGFARNCSARGESSRRQVSLDGTRVARALGDSEHHALAFRAPK